VWHFRKHRERSIWVRSRLRVRHLLREHRRDPVRPTGAGGLGSSQEAPMHVARSVREVRHVQAVPRRHAGRGQS